MFAPNQTLWEILGLSIENPSAFIEQVRETILRTWTRNSAGVLLIHPIAFLFYIYHYVYMWL